MNLRNNNIELKKKKKPGCRGITQRDSVQVKLRNPQLNNMLLRPRHRRVQITKKSKRMNNSKCRAEFFYLGQGIKRGGGGAAGPKARVPVCASGSVVGPQAHFAYLLFTLRCLCIFHHARKEQMGKARS